MHTYIMQVLPIICLVHSDHDIQFDQNFVGVVFSPYVRNMEGNYYPRFNNYTIDEVENMLLLVSSKFQLVSTLYMDTIIGRPNSSQDESVMDFTGLAAARLNRKKSVEVIKLLLGVEMHTEDFLADSGIKKAYRLVQEANSIHKGTVWGVTIITYARVTTNEGVDKVLKMIAKGKEILGNESNSVKYGVHLGYAICVLVYDKPKRVEYLTVLLKSVDYICCDLYPDRESAVKGVEYAAKIVMDLLNNIQSTMKVINPEIIVFGDTGWPSSGVHFDTPPSTINMVNYWQEVDKIASETQLHIFMSQAIDEPWRNNVWKDKNAEDGTCGSLGHFGWWRRNNNKIISPDGYIEKIEDLQLPRLLPRCEEIELKRPKDIPKSLDDFQFDKNVVGVVFSPYVKNLEGNLYPTFNNYTVNEVETMLLLISSKFQTILSTNIGTTGRNQSWEEGDATGFTAIAAARLNQKKSSTVIKVILGAELFKEDFIVDWETYNAIRVAKEANRIRAGTVWGVTITNRYISNNETVHDVLKMIAKSKDILGNESYSLKYGVQLDFKICILVADKLKTGDYLKVLLKLVDFIICDVYPNEETASKGVHYAALLMMHVFDKIQAEMKAINPEIIVFGETGWPSSGVHFDMPPSTINMANYWHEIAKIASETHFRIFMFQAIDEPWRNNVWNDKRANDGPCGSLGHFGWWRRRENQIATLDAYVQKINGILVLSYFDPCYDHLINPLNSIVEKKRREK